MATLTLYTNPRSRGSIARWMLEEVGRPYDVVPLDYGPAMQAPGFLALNPMGKVPVLTHGDAVITETAAICTYLADTFPETGLMPEDRARFYRWMFFAAGPMEHAVANRALAVDVPEAKRGFVGYGTFDRMFATLQAHVAGCDAFLAGPQFSALDVYMGNQIGWGLMFGTLPADPALTAYWDRVKDRPARARAIAADAALAPEKV